MASHRWIFISFVLNLGAICATLGAQAVDAIPPQLKVGIAGHAFDHLGLLDEQADAAIRSGSTIIYGTGLGAVGYGGLPKASELAGLEAKTAAYLGQARANGLQLALGYVCATSIVKLDSFAENWPAKFRSGFSTVPNEWLQQDRSGKALASWYGGDYRPACMNHPDWRAYERFIVGKQIAAGFDGIFFDNPTVHPQGCFCAHCMAEFALFLAQDGFAAPATGTNALEQLRELAVSQPNDFLRFRGTIAANFLAEMRSHARSLKADALVTCNNSLNTPEAFFSQARTYGYNIFELSKSEDLVVVEDMVNQPRTTADGKVYEYGPIYELVHAISHGKPLIAVTIADGDYHTPPNLVRLALAEAAAHRASYLGWPTWPEEQRQKMIAGIRPQAAFLRQHASLLNEPETVIDALLFVPYRRFTNTVEFPAVEIARQLSRSNVAFGVTSEANLAQRLSASKRPTVLLAESSDVFTEAETAAVESYQRRGGRLIVTTNAEWFEKLQSAIGRPAVVVRGPTTVRAILKEHGKRRFLHLLNLDVRRLSSFMDEVRPATNVVVELRAGSAPVRFVTALSADSTASQGLIPFKVITGRESSSLTLTVPRLDIATILILE